MSDDTAKWENLTDLARKFVDEMNSGSMDATTARLNEQMKASMPGDALATLWNGVQQQAGAYQGEDADEVRTNVEQGYDCIYLRAKFEKAPLYVKVVFEGTLIAGLQFVPQAP